MKAKHHKQALVTGGNRGIGFAIAKGLLINGFEVTVTARSLQQATQAAVELQGPVIPMQLDVTDDQAIHHAVEALGQHSEHLDVLINNAGIYPDNGYSILTISSELLDVTMSTNAFGAIRMAQACLPLLRKAQNGRIINVSSGYGALGDLSATVPSYCLSKLVLNGATILLAQALAAKNIAVNALCPGWVRTDMGGLSASRSPEQGADTAIWLATEAPQKETGKFWRDRKVISFC